MIRPAAGPDLDIIADSWLKSFRHSDFAKSVRDTEFFTGHQLVIERLLTQNGACVLCDEKDETIVLAWLCHTEPDTMHYVYVKESCRGLGMASELMEAAGLYRADPLYVSHITRKVKRWKDNGKHIRYDPYRVGR